jgi:glutathione synthase/RimK-type ligase-like ATP-grasp enzyme
MADTDETNTKTHYICQTYVEKKQGSDVVTLAIDKQFEYSTASDAEERAEREYRNETCVGADAYMIVEDSQSDEVGTPDFLVRLGNVPDDDGS